MYPVGFRGYFTINTIKVCVYRTISLRVIESKLYICNTRKVATNVCKEVKLKLYCN